MGRHKKLITKRQRKKLNIAFVKEFAPIFATSFLARSFPATSQEQVTHLLSEWHRLVPQINQSYMKLARALADPRSRETINRLAEVGHWCEEAASVYSIFETRPNDLRAHLREHPLSPGAIPVLILIAHEAGRLPQERSLANQLRAAGVTRYEEVKEKAPLLFRDYSKSQLMQAISKKARRK